jgi:hypothetical protein
MFVWGRFRSHKYIKNRRQLRTAPWGRPLETDFLEEMKEFTWRTKERSDR